MLAVFTNSFVLIKSITHYYHWAAELWFGFWRTYSSLDSLITDQGNTTLPPIDRIMFRHLDATHWRDYASLNQWIIRSNFPSIAMEFIDDWRERAELGATYVLDRVVLADRSGAMQSFNFARYQRSASAAFSLPGSASWWLTMRNNVIQYAGLSAAAGEGTTKRPVITYISRQEWGRRMLIKEDHDRLVNELYKLRDNYGYEVNIVAAEKMSRVEQLRLAARTTVGLTWPSTSFWLLALIPTSNELDYDGSSWKWFDVPAVDEPNSSVNCDRILFPWWICARL